MAMRGNLNKIIKNSYFLHFVPEVLIYSVLHIGNTNISVPGLTFSNFPFLGYRWYRNLIKSIQILVKIEFTSHGVNHSHIEV